MHYKAILNTVFKHYIVNFTFKKNKTKWGTGIWSVLKINFTAFLNELYCSIEEQVLTTGSPALRHLTLRRCVYLDKFSFTISLNAVGGTQNKLMARFLSKIWKQPDNPWTSPLISSEFVYIIKWHPPNLAYNKLVKQNSTESYTLISAQTLTLL